MRALLVAAVLAQIVACTDEDWGGEHHSVGDLTITIRGAGALSTRTWNASSTCTVDPDADADADADATPTTCSFPIEDDGAEIVVVPLDAAATVDFEVSACGKPASEDVVEVRGNGIALRPREVLLDVGCARYPVRIEAKIADAPPDDAGTDAAEAGSDAAEDADDETGG